MDASVAVERGQQASEADSLAVVLGGIVGSRRLAQRMATKLGEPGELERLARMRPVEIAAELRMPIGGALRVWYALELARRVAQVAPPAGPVVRGAADLEPHLRGLLAGRLKEVFLVVLLDAKNRPIRTERVSEGCLTWSVVHPREVYAPAVRESAGAIIVAHNHPSGDPTPSAQDVEVTARLARVGETLGIPLLDHIVVGRTRCVSLRAQGLLGGAS